jgi:hypothetical protein
LESHWFADPRTASFAMSARQVNNERQYKIAADDRPRPRAWLDEPATKREIAFAKFLVSGVATVRARAARPGPL